MSHFAKFGSKCNSKAPNDKKEAKSVVVFVAAYYPSTYADADTHSNTDADMYMYTEADMHNTDL